MDNWLTHEQFEQLDPGAAMHARQIEEARRANFGDRYRPRRQFPCPGVFEPIERSGPPSATLYVCSECGETMGLPVAFNNSRTTREWFIERAGLPAHHAAVKIDNDPSTQTVRAELLTWVKAYAAGQVAPPPLLVGGVGTGKTQLLVHTALTVLGAVQRPLHYWSLAELLDQQRASFKDDTAEHVRPVERAKGIDLLLLDDLGAERGSEFATDVLGQIVDARYRAGRPLLAATNVMPAEWPQVFGDRTASRLVEATRPIMVGGRDRRLP